MESSLISELDLIFICSVVQGQWAIALLNDQRIWQKKILRRSVKNKGGKYQRRGLSLQRSFTMARHFIQNVLR